MPVGPHRAAVGQPARQQRGQRVTRDGERGRPPPGGAGQAERPVHHRRLGCDDQDVARAAGGARQRGPREAGLVGQEWNVPLQVERDHAGEVAALGARKLEGLHDHEAAIQPEAQPCARKPARRERPGERGGGIRSRLDGHPARRTAGGDRDRGDAALLQIGGDPGSHDAGSGCQAAMVGSSGAPGRPRRITATTRLRTPAARPSASTRKTALPTARPRPAKRPGTWP